MKIGILGSGNVAQALGRGFAKHGHSVTLGTRDPESGKLDAWRTEVGENATVGTLADAAEHGELIILAVLGSAVEAAIDGAGRNRFTGKVVIDATNPLESSSEGAVGVTDRLDDSNGERVQRALPKARVVKAFNTVPNSRMIDPGLAGARLMICGENEDAKKSVTDLLVACGWSGVIDVGGIADARWLEAIVPLWVRVGMALDRWDHVFDVR